MLTKPENVIDQEERIRAFWMTEVLDSVSTLGTGWNGSISCLEMHALLPCNETVWGFDECAVEALPALNLERSSVFSLYVRLVMGNLVRVHMFLRQKFDRASIAEWRQQQETCKMMDGRLNDWRQCSEIQEAIGTSGQTTDALAVLISATLNM
jgi:hypothetical protein